MTSFKSTLEAFIVAFLITGLLICFIASLGYVATFKMQVFLETLQRGMFLPPTIGGMAALIAHYGGFGIHGN